MVQTYPGYDASEVTNNWCSLPAGSLWTFGGVICKPLWHVRIGRSWNKGYFQTGKKVSDWREEGATMFHNKLQPSKVAKEWHNIPL